MQLLNRMQNKQQSKQQSDNTITPDQSAIK